MSTPKPMPKHGIVQLLYQRASKILRSRSQQTQGQRPDNVLLSELRDRVLESLHTVDTKLSKLCKSMKDYQVELAKRERIANSKIPSVWKWPLTDNELALQIHEMAQWWQAQVAWGRRAGGRREQITSTTGHAHAPVHGCSSSTVAFDKPQ
jgi:hypothetical protein